MKKLNYQGFGALEGLLILVIVVVIGFAGWWVYKTKNDTNKTLANTSQGAGDAQKTTKPASTPTTTPTYRVPDGFAVYENKSIGLKFAYPQSKTWNDITKGNSAVTDSVVKVQSISSFVYAHDQGNGAVHYSASSGNWIDANGKNAADPPKTYTAANGDKVFVFLGGSGQDGSDRWVVIKHGDNMVQFDAAFIDASASLDTAVTGNRKAYLQADFDKDLETMLTTFVNLK